VSEREGRLPLTIRPMVLADVEAVYVIDRLSFSLPWTERSYRYEIMENPNALAWVAEAALPDGSHRVVGMIVTWLIVDEAHVGTIAVHPDYRKLGIGRRLLAICLAATAKKGAVQALLEVRRGNDGARRMYERFGFEVVGVRPRYYRDNGEDALLMTLHPLDLKKLIRLGEESADA
jgi:[ribosomal protein S18]-alanine N-acetyltransferase